MLFAKDDFITIETRSNGHTVAEHVKTKQRVILVESSTLDPMVHSVFMENLLSNITLSNSSPFFVRCLGLGCSFQAVGAQIEHNAFGVFELFKDSIENILEAQTGEQRVVASKFDVLKTVETTLLAFSSAADKTGAKIQNISGSSLVYDSNNDIRIFNPSLQFTGPRIGLRAQRHRLNSRANSAADSTIPCQTEQETNEEQDLTGIGELAVRMISQEAYQKLKSNESRSDRLSIVESLSSDNSSLVPLIQYLLRLGESTRSTLEGALEMLSLETKNCLALIAQVEDVTRVRANYFSLNALSQTLEELQKNLRDADKRKVDRRLSGKLRESRDQLDTELLKLRNLIGEYSYKNSEADIDNLIDSMQKQYEEETPDNVLKLSDAYLLKAKCLLYSNKLAGAEGQIELAISKLSKCYKESQTEQFASIYLTQADIQLQKQEYDLCLHYLTNAYSIYITRSGHGSYGAGCALLKIAALEVAEYELDFAQEHIDKAKEVFTGNKRFGTDLRSCQIDVLELEGLVEIRKENPANAMEKYKEAQKICLERYGKSHPRYADLMLKIAHVNLVNEMTVLADQQISTALEVYSDHDGIFSPKCAECYNARALVYAANGKDKEAFENLNKALDIETLILGKNHISYIESLQVQAAIYAAKKDYNKATAVQSQCVKLFSDRSQMKSRAEVCRIKLVELLYQQKNYEKAKSELDISMKYFARLRASFETFQGKMHFLNGKLCLLKDNTKDARVSFQKRIEIGRKVYGNTKVFADDLVMVGDSYRGHKTLIESALEYYNEAKEIYKRVLGADHVKMDELEKKIHKVKTRYIRSLVLI